MRIGSVRPPQTSVLQPSRAAATPQDFGAGVATALAGLGSTIQQAGINEATLIAQEKDRQRKKRGQELRVDFLRRRGETTRLLEERKRGVEPGADGFTEQAHETVREQFQPFLESIEDPDLKARYEAQIEQFTQNATTAAYSFEFEETNRKFISDTESLLDDARVRLREDPDRLIEELDTLTDMIADSTLTAPQKDEVLSSVVTQLQTTAFQSELERAMNDTAPVRPADGSDVVAPGVPAFRRGLLNTIAGTESPDYQTLNGGEKISDLSSHPCRTGAGGTSTAAGRYQFLCGTWKDATASYNAAHPERQVTDFSPVSQDLVASHWVEVRYNMRNEGGPSFAEIEQNPTVFNIQQMRKTLIGEWEGLQNITDAQFVEGATGKRGIAAGGTGTAEAPDIWDDERFSDIPFDQRMKLEAAAQKSQQDLADALRKQQEEARAARLETLEQRAFQGQLSTSDLSQLRDELGLSAGEEKKLRGFVDDARERDRSAVSTQARMADGLSLTGQDAAGVDEILRRAEITDGIARADGEAFNTARPTLLRAGFVPPDLAETFSAQLGASDPATRAFALSSLASLEEDNANILDNSDFINEERADVATFRKRRKFFAPGESGEQQLLQEMRASRDNFQGRQVSQIRQEGLELFQEEYETSSDLVDVWNGLFTSAPALPQTASQLRTFTSDMREAYIEGYMRTGDTEQAQTFMETWAKQHWGTTTFGGSEKTLMKYPPEKVWGSEYPDGNLDAAKDQLTQELLTEGRFVEGDRVILQADSQTQADIKARQAGTRDALPRYNVLVQDANGIIKDAGSYFHPTPSVDQREQAMRKGRLAEAEATQAEVRQRVKDLEAQLRISQARPDMRANMQGELEAAREQLRELEASEEEVRAPVEEFADPATRGSDVFATTPPENFETLSTRATKDLLTYFDEILDNKRPAPNDMLKGEIWMMRNEILRGK